jgi:dihydroxyacid dehydratase/phosphogluconate dehydratase
MYDESTRTIKAASISATGTVISSHGDMHHIAILDCVGYDITMLVKSISSGVTQSGNAVVSVFGIENFGYIKSITPATAKYAADYPSAVSKMTDAIIKTNLVDCVVAVIDGDITARGVLMGCIKANCPVVLMPVGVNKSYDESIFGMAGKIAIREIKSSEVPHAINKYVTQYGISPAQTVTDSFFITAENLGLMLPNTHDLKWNCGEIFTQAAETGKDAFTRADNITTVKRLLNKKTVAEAIQKSVSAGASADGILKYKKIFEMADLALPTELLNPIKGTACGEGYISLACRSEAANKPFFEGKAWVYDNIADALTALVSNAIDSGVVVVKNCVGQDVSIITKTIAAMKKQTEIAVATDGCCGASAVLTITNISPNGYINEEFANIQTGDILEIDTVKGRFNTDVSAKDMRLRAKRNIVKKQEVFF